MFETVLGIPAHPLLVHAAVVFVPLTALGSALYAAVPRLRPRIWWAVAALAVVGVLAAVLTKLSGDAFHQRLIARNLASPEILDKIGQHKSYGDVTAWLTVLLAVATMAYVFVLPWLLTGTARPTGEAAAIPGAASTTAADAADVPASAAEMAAVPVGGGPEPRPEGGTGEPAAAGGQTALARVIGRLGVSPGLLPARPVALSGSTGLAIEIGLRVGTLVLAVMCLYYVFRTGDSGAHIVWQGY